MLKLTKVTNAYSLGYVAVYKDDAHKEYVSSRQAVKGEQLSSNEKYISGGKPYALFSVAGPVEEIEMLSLTGNGKSVYVTEAGVTMYRSSIQFESFNCEFSNKGRMIQRNNMENDIRLVKANQEIKHMRQLNSSLASKMEDHLAAQLIANMGFGAIKQVVTPIVKEEVKAPKKSTKKTTIEDPE